MEDLQLLQEYARSGSEEAFRKVVEQHVHFVYSAARRQVNDPTIAEDVTQAVFIALARKAQRLRGSTLLIAWLHRAVRFASLHALRAETRRRERERIAQEWAREEPIPPDLDDDWAQLQPLLDEALAGLPLRHREAILLRFFHNSSFSEIGAALGISEDAAKKRVVRAVDRLRGILRRRRLALSGTAATVLLAQRTVQSAPPHLVSAVFGLAHARDTAVRASVQHLVQKVMNTFLWLKIRTVAFVTLALAATVVLLPRTWSAPAPGRLDASFQRARTPGLVSQVAVQPDGRILILASTPEFVQNGGLTGSHRVLRRLHPDGSLDPSFRSSTNYIPDSFALQPDGRIVVGGSLVQNQTARRSTVFRLLPDGAFDSSFQAGVGTELDTYLPNAVSIQIPGVAVDREENILAAGTFLEFGGQPQPGIVRLRPDGTVDPAFVGPGRPGDQASRPLFQSDGRAVLALWVLAAGSPVHPVLGSRSARIARLRADGTLDPQFRKPSPQGSLKLLAVQPDDRLICSEIMPGPSRNLVRLNADGTLDASYTVTLAAVADTDGIAIASIQQAMVQPDGRVIALGIFNRANGQPIRGMARFHVDGRLDTGFSPGNGISELKGAQLQALALQGDGRILVGGAFLSDGIASRVYLARFWGDPSLQLARTRFGERTLECALLPAMEGVVEVEASPDLVHWTTLAILTNRAPELSLALPLEEVGWKFFRASVR